MFFNRIIFNPLISFCSAEFPLGSFTRAFLGCEPAFFSRYTVLLLNMMNGTTYENSAAFYIDHPEGQIDKMCCCGRLGDGYTHFCMEFVNRQLMTGNENQVKGTKMTREMVQCVVALCIIQFRTSASLLVTAEHADQFVEDNRPLLLSYHYHAKAYERFFENNRVAVDGDIFLESKEDVHAAFQGLGQEKHILCDGEGDDLLDKVALRAKRRKRLHDYFSKKYPNGFVDEYYK